MTDGDISGAMVGLLGTAILVDVAGKVVGKKNMNTKRIKLKHKGGIKWMK